MCFPQNPKTPNIRKYFIYLYFFCTFFDIFKELIFDFNILSFFNLNLKF
jgi:hypothetical protein